MSLKEFKGNWFHYIGMLPRDWVRHPRRFSFVSMRAEFVFASVLGFVGCGGIGFVNDLDNGSTASEGGIAVTQDGSVADVFAGNDAMPDASPEASVATTECGVWPAATGDVLEIGPESSATLAETVRKAKAGTTLVLRDGTYDLSASIQMYTSGVTLRSKSNDATKVTLDARYVVAEAIAIGASDVIIAHVTIKRAVDHPIHAYPSGASTISGITIYGVVLEDGGEQFLKANGNEAKTAWVDSGRVECSRFRMTTIGRTKVEPNPGGCYTGGIDVHGGRNWVVRHNTFEEIYCAGTGLAEHAIHFWRGARDTLIENNVINNCARGIGLGLDSVVGRTYSDDPYPGVSPISHYGGIVRNNVVFADHAFFDTGIELDQARGSVIVHNTVFSPTPSTGQFFSSIDYRFANTDVEIRNNIVRKITQRDGGKASVSNNFETNDPASFLNVKLLDFHLAPGASGAIDKGVAHASAGVDLDGQPHNSGAPDVGADER